MKAIMSVDVEEWFHIPDGLDNMLEFSKWDNAVQRVQHVLPRLFDIFEKNNATATFFFLGWIAERHPDLVREALNRGHEVATHGYAHKLIYNQSLNEFESDLYKSKSIIENIAGDHLKGFRAPGFSVTPDTVWAFDILLKHGFKYDSSVFPGKRFYGHFDKFSLKPVVINSGENRIVEFPQSVINMGFLRFSFFGGGYFRLFPSFVFLGMAEIVEKKGRPLIVYLHPRDIDPDQPRFDFPYLKKLRHYVNISGACKKLEKISSSISFSSFDRVLSDESFLNELESLELSHLK